MSFKPTLAVAADYSKIQYSVYASPKLDGIRCSIVGGRALSRTLKAIPNRHIYEVLSKPEYEGLDGELIIGSPTSKSVYRDTTSGVMGHEGEPNFTYYVFDLHNAHGVFENRLGHLRNRVSSLGINRCVISVLDQVLMHDEDEMLEYEAKTVTLGYEGLILRSLTAPYKYGRSTVKEGYMLKVKRFEDSDAEIIGFEEEMFNGNTAETNELGRTKRSTAQAGLVGKNTLGAFLVRDVKSKIEFSIGTGLTAADRQAAWNSQKALKGKLLKYKFFAVGVKVAPRHPVFLGYRDKVDL